MAASTPLSVCAIALLAFASDAFGQTQPSFTFQAAAGPYAVGLKVVEQYDNSRVYGYSTDALGKLQKKNSARPVQTLVWYPAEATDAAPMTVRDYLTIWATERSFGKPRRSAVQVDWILAMTPALDTRLRSIRNARPTPGRFPVVIYAAGGSNMSWDNADLCEFVASFGYVVLASPSLGTASGMTYDVDGANAQASDIRFLVGYASTGQDTARSPVAVIGDSWGGMAGLFAAARDTRISALVALDGSMRYYPGLITRAGDVHPEVMSIPLLFFMQGDYSLEDRQRSKDRALEDGPSFLLQWTHGDLVVAHMLGMAHASLSSMWQRREDYWSAYGASPWQPGDYSREDAVVGYAWVATYTLKFLDAYLKHDPRALEFLKASPTDNGVPKHMMAVEFRAGSGAARSYEEFRAEIGRRGFDQAYAIYTAFRKEDPKFTLDEASVADWAQELIGDEHLAEALALLRANQRVHPDSSEAEALLGDVHRLSGDKPAAVAAYKRAVEKDPSNLFVAKKLRELEATITP